MKLQEIEKHGQMSPELKEMYDGILSQATTAMDEKPWTVKLRAPKIEITQSAIWKFVAGYGLWALLSLISVPDLFRRKPGSASAFFGFHFLGLIFGGLNMVIPTLFWPWFNLLVAPIVLLILSFAVIVFAASKMGKKKELNEA